MTMFAKFKQLLKKASKTEPDVTQRRKEFLMAGTAGAAALVSLLSRPAEALSIPPKLLGGLVFNINNFFLPGDTNYSPALIRAIAAASVGGGRIYFPASSTPYVMGATVDIGVPNITLFGDGQGASVIQAESGAGLVYLFSTSTAATHFTAMDITFDGNRAGGGTVGQPNYGVFLSASHQKMIRIELTNFIEFACCIGSNAGDTYEYLFDGCYIHDNGGLTNGSDGVGINGVGTSKTIDVKIVNCHFEDNHNTVGPDVGDSTAFLLSASRNVVISGNYFKNNYNRGGGQFSVAAQDNMTHDICAVITNNIIEQTSTLGTEVTSGIEVYGNSFVISNNIILNTTSAGIYLDNDVADSVGCANGVISGNIITAQGACVILPPYAGNNVQIIGNEFRSGAYGVLVMGACSASVTDNVFSASLTTFFSGPQFVKNISNNIGYQYRNSFVGTLTGCTTTPTATFRYTKEGDTINLALVAALSATSNSTTKTVTGLPAEIVPLGQVFLSVPIGNNSVWSTGLLLIDGSGVITLYATPAGGAFTNSGVAGVAFFNFTYRINNS